MANSYTIVAIPSDDDNIWKISSEKVPHLTLLFLGESVENVKQVTEFIAHSVKTNLHPFWLDSLHRGILGDQFADVLFFENSVLIDKLKDFRSYLLTNQDIRNGYDSVEQFPTWIPHLTLGYPNSPANPDRENIRGMKSIYFDRIALWDGDYEGVEFPLTTDDSFEAKMSAKGSAFLEHYGVKGMRWGVRHTPSSADSTTSEDAQRAADTQNKVKLGGTKSLSNKELQDLVTRMNLEQQYSRLYGTQPSAFDRGKKFINNAAFVGETLNKAIAFSKSPAGRLIRKSMIGF